MVWPQQMNAHPVNMYPGYAGYPVVYAPIPQVLLVFLIQVVSIFLRRIGLRQSPLVHKWLRAHFHQ